MYKNVNLDSILNDFNIINFDLQKIKEKNTKKTRIVYKINTYDNLFCLKQTYFDIKDLLFIYSYLEWLKIYGFTVPYLIKTKFNEPYTKINDKIFILTKWMKGENINYDNFDHCIQSMIFLSKIHNISTNIIFIQNSKIKNTFIDLNKRYKKHINYFKNVYEVANSSNDYFSKIFIKNFNNIMYLCNISNKFSSIINYKKLNISICHGDYVSKNILIDNNKILPIDFDRSCINFSIFDVGYFLRRYLRRDLTNWNFDNTIKLINYYKKNNPIFLDEYLYLISYLAFPQKIFKITKIYFSNIDRFSSSEKDLYKNLLLKNCKTLSNHINFINQFSNYININF